MARLDITGAAGLVTSPNRIGLGGKGYFSKTNNVLVRQAGVIGPRFGTESVGSTQSNVDRLFFDPKNQQMVRASSSTNVLQKNASGTWTNLDTSRSYSALEPARNFAFVLSSEGLRKINATNDGTELGWVPEGLDLNIQSTSTTGGWQAADSQIAYKIVFGIKTDEDEFFLGAPSGRAISTNASGGSAIAPTIRASLPDDLTTSYFYQVYRTDPSPSDDTDPGAEYFQIYEEYVTSTDISNGYIEFTDYIPLLNGGASLYTNASQQTDLQANYPPEAAASSIGNGDLATFAGCLWASSYIPRSSIEIHLLGVQSIGGLNYLEFTCNTTSGSPTLSSINPSQYLGRLAVGMKIANANLPAGTTVVSWSTGATTITVSNNATATASTVSTTASDKITVGLDTYYAGSTEDIANGIFKISTAVSASLAVRETAESLVRVINRYAGNGEIYAQYVSGVNEFAGRIRIFARTDRASTYTVTATHGQAFTPNITTAQTILSKAEPGRIVFSKPDEPNGFPPLNYVQIPGDATVYSLSALRAALLIWTDRGLYRITGTYGNFALDLIDASLIYNASSSGPGLGSVVVDNIAYALTKKGLVAATETGADIISGAVSTYLRNIDPPSACRLGRHYGDGLIFVPTSWGTLIWQTESATWVGWSDQWSVGEYSLSENKYYLHKGTQTYKSRDSSYQASNLYDADESVTISSTTATTVTLSGAPTLASAGDVLIQSSEEQVILAINGAVLTLSDASGYSAASATIRVGYDCEVQYCPVAPGGPHVAKKFNTADIAFDGAAFTSNSLGTFDNTDYGKLVTFEAISDLDKNVRSQSKLVEVSDYPFVARYYVPRDVSRCNVLQLGVKWRNTANATRLIGVGVDFDPAQEMQRTKR